MEEILTRVKFLTLSCNRTGDLSKAFHQNPMAAKSRQMTASVVYGKGIFEFGTMPFGLKGATATFERTIWKILMPEMSPFVMAYIDDIIISTSSWEERLHWLRKVITRILEAGFLVNRDKSFFGKTEIKYLGFIVDGSGTGIDPDKIWLIMEYPQPKNLKQRRRYLGLCSWFRRYIPNPHILRTLKTIK